MSADQNLTLVSFDTDEVRDLRLQLLGKIGETGDWYCQLSDQKVVWSDYLYEFYEVDRSFTCSLLLEHTNYYGEDGRATMSAMLQEVMTRRAVKGNEFKINFPDGRVKWHRTTISPIADESGKVTGLYGILHNITNQKQVNISAIKKTEIDLQRMAIVAEKTNGIVMVTDANRKITWVNNSFERILGYQNAEVIGRDPADFLQGPETSQQTIKQIAESLKKTGSFSGEILNYTKSGKKIWLYLDIASVYDDSGQLISFVAVENDISVVKLAEERLQKSMEKERQLNQFKTQFVNLASHQFRTPLATIRSSIDLLDLKTQSENLNADFKKFLFKHKEIIAEEVLRMTELRESVLDIGRIDEGKIEIIKKPLSFKKFMDDFVRSNQERTGEFRKLNYHFDAENRKMPIDKIILQNVLRNIVSNAFKYSQGKSAPELSVNFDKGRYFVIIKDYGIGVPSNEHAYLFESFFRASNARNYPGTGLGLMIARKLTTLHGGDLYFSSEVGKGCCVTIELLT